MEVDAVESELPGKAQAAHPAVPQTATNAGAGAGSEAPVNPRKRKKASRA